MRLKSLNFRGERLNFVQIGLGTNSTFIHNLKGQANEWSRSIDWLFTCASERRPGHVRGIAVEPVAELVEALKSAVDHLPAVEIVQAAMGERDAADVEMTVFAPSARNAILDQARPSDRERVAEKLEYMFNMSCIGGTHPMLTDMCQQLVDEFNVHVSPESQRAELWSWGRLVQTCGFKGCEVLVIDAEGHDARILRSMIEHCKNEPASFPWLLQFETMGHCDRLDGRDTEWKIISQLEEVGYVVVNCSKHNTHMVYRQALNSEPRLQNWVQEWVCTSCKAHGALPYVSSREGPFCEKCVQNGERKRVRDSNWSRRPHGGTCFSPPAGSSFGSWSRTSAPTGGPSAEEWSNGTSSSGGSPWCGWSTSKTETRSSSKTETWTASSGWSGSPAYEVSETRSYDWKEYRWSTCPNGCGNKSASRGDWEDGNSKDPRDNRQWPPGWNYSSWPSWGSPSAFQSRTAASPPGGPSAEEWTKGFSSSSGGSSARGWSSTETETWTASSGWNGGVSEKRPGGWKEYTWSSSPNGWSGCMPFEFMCRCVEGVFRCGVQQTKKEWSGSSGIRGDWESNPRWANGNSNGTRDDRQWPPS